MINWIKTHKLSALLLAVVVYFVFGGLIRSIFGVNTLDFSPQRSMAPSMGEMGVAAPSSFGGAGIASLSMPLSDGGIAADVPKDDRLVIQESNLSLLVDDVRASGDKIVKFAEDRGGFMVATSYTRPDESPFGRLTVRIPSNILNEALDYFRSQGVKVTSENLVGRDITEQYINIEERITTLEDVKSRYENILENATQVQDILTVQRELINTQAQIDSLVGQKQSLEENARFTKITIFLSTDELSLPYTPDDKFRPQVVFKLAVRSMLGTLVWLGETAIWIGVYAVVWVPALLLFIAYKKWQARHKAMLHKTS